MNVILVIRRLQIDFYGHFKGKVGHEPKWNGTVFVAKEKHWWARKIKEAIVINAINPTKNVQSGGIMNLEKGYEMDPIWSGFNGVFRR